MVAQGSGATQPSAIAWLDALTGTQIALIVGSIVLLGLLAAQGWLLLNLMNQSGQLRHWWPWLWRRAWLAGRDHPQRG